MKPLEISVFTHGLSDMALWAGLAICGSPLRGEDVQKFKFSSLSHCTACILNKAALMRYQAPAASFALHCLRFEQGSSHEVSGSDSFMRE